jgi:hypothetical protein
MAAYALAVGVFLYALAQTYIPGKGFSYLIAFGGKHTMPRVAAMDGLDYYVLRDSDGYDGQYYAQIAMTPGLTDPRLDQAVDGVPYRARRILFSWTAFALGLGRPAWILQAYALQNALCWLVLAAVLLRWFPPRSWGDFLRWIGVLFSLGMCTSVHNSLLDGPSLLLIALGVWAAEKKCPWLAAGVFAVSGLAKETNLLGAAALARPESRAGRDWLLVGLRWALAAAPLALWLVYIQRNAGPAGDVGFRNFDWPLAAYGRKWLAVLNELPRPEKAVSALNGLLMLVAVTVQFLFLVLRPLPRAEWWRAGIAFAGLMVVLGDAVWEGYPGAASRVLLAMQLAFNVLVPRGRAWLAVLVLGNLTLLSAPGALEPPPGNGYRIDGPAALVVGAGNRQAHVEFDAAWFLREGSRKNTWCWSRGDAAVALVNPQDFPVEARVTLALRSITPRHVTIGRRGGAVLWRGDVGGDTQPVTLPALVLAPGRNAIEFKTDQPPAKPQSGDARELALCVKNLTVELQRRVPPP